MKHFALFLTALALPAAILQAQTTITNQPDSQVVWAGTDVTFTVGATGSGPFTYQWELDQIALPTNVITTLAGGGVGDNGPATNANLWTPLAVVVDARGNVYIADEQHNRIRKIDTNGMITTVAGTGDNTSAEAAVRPEGSPRPDLSSPFPGDGGPATNAPLSDPTGLALDSNGILFIADGGDNRICKVDTNGIITTVAGNGAASYSGDGGMATNASLDFPSGVALDGMGNVLIADNFNNVIRKVDANGIITTIAGTNLPGFSGDGGPATNAQFSSPRALAVDARGNLFITDLGNERLRKVDTNGIITTYAGTNGYGFSGDGGLATHAQLWNAEGVTVDANGRVYISDSSNNRIRAVDTNGIITTVAGTNAAGYFGDGGPATNAALYNPNCAAFDTHANLFIADSFNNRIRKVSNGIITTVGGNGSPYFSGDGGLAIKAGLGGLGSVAADGDGNVYVEDLGDGRVRKVSTNGIITTCAGTGVFGYNGDGIAATNAELDYPVGLAADKAGDLFIAEEENNRIRKVDTHGIISTIAGTNTSGFSGDGGPATNAQLSGPTGVALDATGNLYIADASNQRIRKVDTQGIITTVAGNGVLGPYLIGTFSGDGGPATNAGLSDPSSVAVDAAGDLFIGDTFNRRIRRVGANGIITTYAGNGTFGSTGDGGPATNAQFKLTSGLIVDRAGNLFIADSSGNRIREVGTNGIITTYAGDGATGFAGDGGAAINASINGPYDVAFDPNGNLLITDSGNQRVRKVTNTPQGPVLTLTDVTPADAGNYQAVITGPGGSITSSVATLIVANAPEIYQTTRSPNGNVALSFVSPPGSINLTLAATNLSPPVLWTPISTNVASANGQWQFTDTNTSLDPAKFYRSETR